MAGTGVGAAAGRAAADGNARHVEEQGFAVDVAKSDVETAGEAEQGGRDFGFRISDFGLREVESGPAKFDVGDAVRELLPQRVSQGGEARHFSWQFRNGKLNRFGEADNSWDVERAAAKAILLAAAGDLGIEPRGA